MRDEDLVSRSISSFFKTSENARKRTSDLEKRERQNLFSRDFSKKKKQENFFASLSERNHIIRRRRRTKQLATKKK